MTFNQIKPNDFILVLKPVMRNRKEDDKIITNDYDIMDSNRSLVMEKFNMDCID